MNNDELKAVFNQQASIYDKQWARMAPIYNGLYFLLETIFAELPSNARILCVGVGTGKELIYLAKKFPGWSFTAVEPSGAMLDICRHAAQEEGVAGRCYFHEGYLDTLPIAETDTEESHDAATCFLVSQFILDKEERSQFFQEIANKLKPNGILVNSDLSSKTDSSSYEAVLDLWQNLMSGGKVSSESLSRMRTAYANNVAILPPNEVASIIKLGGFEASVQFFQSGLLHAWFSHRM